MDCATVHAPAIHDLVTCVVSASGAPWWLTPIVTVLTAAVGGYIALSSIDNARQLARRKATLDLIEKVESTEHYRTLTTAFTRVSRTDGFKHLVRPTDAASKTTRGQIIDYLNHYEIVAIGIRKEILDDAMYRAWMETAFVRDWNIVAPWVQSIRLDPAVAGRDYNRRPFANYEWLAREWAPRRATWLTADDPPLVHVAAPIVASPVVARSSTP